ncbi:MAG: hypothetical protein WC254_00855 [Candidatus Woesearchaeota archaeon]|jgi:hypothetical protein
MKLPTREQCEKYFETYHALDNIKAHCYMVNKVTMFIARKLVQSGEKINLDLVDRLSLLHDLFKPVVIKNIVTDETFKCHPTPEQIKFWKEMQVKYPDKHETEVFYEEFKHIFSEFAALMLHYGDHDIFTTEKTREEQIVHYADWRVHLNTIISLKKRTDDLFVRYNQKIMSHPLGKLQWDKRVADEFAVEKSLFKKLDIVPSDVEWLL